VGQHAEFVADSLRDVEPVQILMHQTRHPMIKLTGITNDPRCSVQGYPAEVGALFTTVPVLGLVGFVGLVGLVGLALWL